MNSLGTCTVMPGSYKIFLQITGVWLPYLVILYSYVMIIRKYKKSKNKVLGKSSSLKPNEMIEASNSARRMSLFEKFTTKQKVETTSFCEAGTEAGTRASLFPPPSKLNEDDISDCGVSNYDFLQRHRTERLKRRRKQEVDMTVTVLVTCLSFIVCNIPASILLVLDPSASSFPEVIIITKTVSLIIEMILYFRLTSLVMFLCGSTLLLVLSYMLYLTSSTDRLLLNHFKITSVGHQQDRFVSGIRCINTTQNL